MHPGNVQPSTAEERWSWLFGAPPDLPSYHSILGLTVFYIYIYCILESENSFSTAIQTGEWLWQHLCDSLRMCSCSERVGRELFSFQISTETPGIQYQKSRLFCLLKLQEDIKVCSFPLIMLERKSYYRNIKNILNKLGSQQSRWNTYF